MISPDAPAKPEIVTIETPGLGDRSYLVHDGRVAVVVDPQRDTDRVLEVVGRLGARVEHVLETHIHNDYVTGGLALAAETGAAYVVPAGDRVAFERFPITDGQQITAGSLVVTARHTPGHTRNHMSYVVQTGNKPFAVFTGGSMLFGAVGRTDLIAREATEELTRAQYRSVRRLAHELPEDVSVHPTHGFGSFCSATETTGTSSTIGQEREHNLALVTEDEDSFVARLLSGLTAYPHYYVHMAPLNSAGPGAPDLSPPELIDPEVLRRRIQAGEWVVDMRPRRAFARAHVSGTVSIEMSEVFATYFGWSLPWLAPVTLIGESREVLKDARRQLARIGVDKLAGAATGTTSELALNRTSSYPVATFEDLRATFGARGPLVGDDKLVLDVRRRDEWDRGHLPGAVHIPFWELADRLTELPEAEVWAHCASGLRASIAASLLDRAGLRCVLVDDDFGRAEKVGLPIEA